MFVYPGFGFRVFPGFLFRGVPWGSGIVPVTVPVKFAEKVPLDLLTRTVIPYNVVGTRKQTIQKGSPKMNATDQKFTRSDVEALLAAELGTTADDVRVTGSSRKIGAFDEFIFYLVPDSEYWEEEVHTLHAHTGANFTELDMTMARSWVAGQTLI
jgi:hypothetical protein